MLNKLYKVFKEIIKQNLLLIIVIIFLILNLVITLPYGIYKPGGTINVDERLVNKKYTSKGSMNLTYVTYLDGKMTNLLLALIMPRWKIEKIENIKYSDEDITDMNRREKIDMYYAISNAKYVAYTHANKTVSIKDINYYVYLVDKEANTELKTGDIIKTIDGIPYDPDGDYVSNLKEGTVVKFKVIRDGREKEVKSTIKKIGDSMKVGIYLQRVNIYNDNLKYKYESRESGSSGGLMLSLAIYNSFVKEDITKGKKICGTGTIDIDGNVGEIGSIEYKILGAIKDECDIFLVPEANYKDAKKELDNNKSKMKLYKVNTFDEALDILK